MRPTVVLAEVLIETSQSVQTLPHLVDKGDVLRGPPLVRSQVFDFIRRKSHDSLSLPVAGDVC